MIAFTAKITVRANSRSKEMHKEMHKDIFTQLVDGPESALSSALKYNENKLSPGNNLKSLVNNFVRKNNQSEGMSTYILEESRGFFTSDEKLSPSKKLLNLLRRWLRCDISWICIKEDKMRACNDEENKLKKKHF